MKILVHLFTTTEEKTYAAVEALRKLRKFNYDITLVGDPNAPGMHPDCYSKIVSRGYDTSAERFDLAITIS